MTVSQTIPQYHLERDVDATHLLAQKEAAAAATRSGPRPGLTDMLIQAIAIVAMGRVVEGVIPRGRGISVVPMLTVSMTFDHRAVDGAVGGAALGGLADLLEGRMVWRP